MCHSAIKPLPLQWLIQWLRLPQTVHEMPGVWLAKFHHTSFSSPRSHCHQLFLILTWPVISFFVLTQPPHFPHISYASYFQPPFTQIYSGLLFIPFLLVCYMIPFQHIPSLYFDCVFLKMQRITSRTSFLLRKLMPGSYGRHEKNATVF